MGFVGVPGHGAVMGSAAEQVGSPLGAVVYPATSSRKSSTCAAAAGHAAMLLLLARPTELDAW
jgi:hypothetical protein